MKKLIFILLLLPFLGQAFDTDTIHGNWAYVDSLKSLRSVNATAVCGIDSNNTIGRCNCQCVLHVRDSISSTQIKNSFSSPVTLIAAPGAGYFIKPISISYYYGYSTAAYTLASQCGLTEGGTTYIENGGAFNLLPTTSNGNSFSNLAVGTLTLTQNQPIKFYSNSSNPTTGGGYLIVYLDYIIEQF